MRAVATRGSPHNTPGRGSAPSSAASPSTPKAGPVTATVRPPVDGGTVLVTGASAGIGRELAVQLAARARTLGLLAPRARRLEEVRADPLAPPPQRAVVALPGHP